MAALTFLSYKGVAQTYQVGPDAPGQPTTKQSEKQQDLGWGSNIQNARLARTAELALQRGDHAQAFSYAQRAAQAAPNDPQLWLRPAAPGLSEPS